MAAALGDSVKAREAMAALRMTNVQLSSLYPFVYADVTHVTNYSQASPDFSVL